MNKELATIILAISMTAVSMATNTVVSAESAPAGGEKSVATAESAPAAAVKPAVDKPTGGKPLEGLVDGVAAFVNGDSVTVRDVVAGIPDQLRMLAQDPAIREKSQQEVFALAYDASLEECVNKKLVLQDYWQGEQRIPDKAVLSSVNEFIEGRYKGDFSALLRELEKTRMTYDDWKAMMEEQIILRSMRQTYVGANIHISPNDIAAVYASRKSELKQPAKVNVLTFALADDASFEAKYAKFKERLAAGEDFGAIAKDLSVDAMAEAGGDYGWIVPDDVLSPVLAAAVKALADGSMSEPVKLGANRYIVFRKDSVPAKTLTLREAQADIERELYNQEAERIYDSWIKRLRGDAKITTFDPF